MSALGRKRTFRGAITMSALPPKADIRQRAVSMSAKGQKLTSTLSAPFILDRLRAKSGQEKLTELRVAQRQARELGASRVLIDQGTRAAPIFTAYFPHKLTIVHYPAIQSFDPAGYRGLADDHKP